MKISSRSPPLLTTVFIVASSFWFLSDHHHFFVSAKPGTRGKGSCKLDILDGVCGDIESDVVTDLCIEAEGFGDKCDDFLDDPRFAGLRYYRNLVNADTCNVRFGAYHLQKYFAFGGATEGLACCPACALDLTELDDDDACTLVQDNNLSPRDCGSTIMMNDGFDGIAVVVNDIRSQLGQNEFYCCSFGRVVQ